jgi:hypothetical protein
MRAVAIALTAGLRYVGEADADGWRGRLLTMLGRERPWYARMFAVGHCGTELAAPPCFQLPL